MNSQYGLNPETIYKIQRVFAIFPEIEEAILYGSRAMGNFKNGSDIDLTLKASKLITDIGNPLSLTKISVALDELDLPYMIDISIYENIKNADLVDHINRVGISFYKRSTFTENQLQ